ncbi:major facilitator superfamily mfs_1 [Stylonychia lemnae]|uniref:Major facilitator superfamily mfs_1 n=1 Tax=Stylonychia lemnae TaxID=5949 RepID=A0A078B5R7_STYLE|nr:major facilitator superfamily mfs_1 [Stylonychia lemnae]|eukprot:CDW88858.1 major facilitator superfamily mfs_1 [Stylonychia lemnae]
MNTKQDQQKRIKETLLIKSVDNDLDRTDQERSTNSQVQIYDQNQSKNNTLHILGVNLKENVGILTGMTIFIVSCLGSLITSFIFQISNLLLKIKFEINNDDELISISSIIYMIIVITQIMVSPIMGVFVDIFGRRSVLTIYFILTGLLCAYLPHSYYVWFDFLAVRLLLAVMANSMLNNTLIPDYVQHQSIGKAVIYKNFSRYIGNFLQPITFISLISASYIWHSFNILAVGMGLTAIYLYFNIKNPSDLVKQHPDDQTSTSTKSQVLVQYPNIGQDATIASQMPQKSRNSFCQKFHQGMIECKKNPILVFCFMQNFIVRMGIVLGSNAYNLWIISSIKDEQTVLEVIGLTNFLSTILSFVIQIPLIKYLDCIRPSVIFTLSHFSRGVSLILPVLIDINSSLFITVTILLIGLANCLTNVARDLIFQKNLNNESRGVIVGFMDFFQYLGILSYLMVYTFLSSVIGLKGCFCFLGILDMLLLLVSARYNLNHKNT